MLVTLDINVLRDAKEPKRPGHSVAAQVLEQVRGGSIEAQVTNRLEMDVPDGALRSMIESLNELKSERPGAPGRIGHSRVGRPDYVVGDEHELELLEATELLFSGASKSSPKHRNRMADVDHLFAHRASGAEYFVTSDKAILAKAKQLSRRYSIEVVSPSELLGRI